MSEIVCPTAATLLEATLPLLGARAVMHRAVGAVTADIMETLSARSLNPADPSPEEYPYLRINLPRGILSSIADDTYTLCSNMRTTG